MPEPRDAFREGSDPFGVRSIAGARAAYLRDEIDVDEFERRVELFLSGRPIAILQPGERVLMPSGHAEG